ncbi:MAG: hypothetical protein RL077_650 [Verrucomicrobiota bacterium]
MHTSSEKIARHPSHEDNILRSPDYRRKCAKIRALLPELKRAVAAFGELHELLDEHDLVSDFDTWCQHQFGVVPELLREATERL